MSLEWRRSSCSLYFATACLSLIATSCTRAPKPPTDSTLASPPSVVAQAGRAAPGAADSNQSADDCGLLRAAINPDPLQLVHHYVELDNAGRFMESTPYTDSLYLCPQHLPGPDEFTVVGSSEVGSVATTGSVARVVVRSTRLGAMTQDSAGFVFVRDPGTVLDTFVVRRTAYGWRIESPELPDRVLGSAVLSHPERFRLRTPVRDSLKASVSRGRD